MEILNWKNVEPLIEKDEPSIDESLPEKNIIQDRIIIGRKKIKEFDRKLWSQIKDKKLPTDSAKKNFAKSYFSTCIYILTRVKSIPVSSNQTYRETVEISHTSTFRSSQTTSFRIENVVEATASYEGNSIRDTLSVSYGSEKLEEYCSEDRKVTTTEVTYESIDKTRNIVFWDLSKVVAIYRKDFKNNIELLCYNDYFIETRQKVYTVE